MSHSVDIAPQFGRVLLTSPMGHNSYLDSTENIEGKLITYALRNMNIRI